MTRKNEKTSTGILSNSCKSKTKEEELVTKRNTGIEKE